MNKRLFLALVVLMVPAIIYWLVLHQLGTMNHPQQTRLAKLGDECAGIADNAVANLPAVVEFQKLEIQGRKFNVMRRCMADKGFVENPAWLAYANPIAQANAIKQSISVDEAIENLKREHMMVFIDVPHQPIYWVPHP
jgi:hypothetical protein